MVTCDQWSYMTIRGIFGLAIVTIHAEIQIGRMLFEESRQECAFLQKICPLKMYVQRSKGHGFIFRYRGLTK